jgi:hypothetical protein
MNARVLSTAAAALVAAALSTTALAGAVANDAKKLVLQQKDFPAGAKLTVKHGQSTAAVSGYYVTYRYKTGSKPRELSSFVSVFKSRSMAVAGYRELKSNASTAASKIVLPKYGDEQVATFQGLDGGELIVRKGNTFWLLKAEYLLEPGLTKAEAIAELKRYAPKQMRRVGSG